MRVLRFLLFLILFVPLAVLLIAVAAGVGAYWALVPQLPSVASLHYVEWQEPLRIYARNGELIAEFGIQRREPVTLEQVPLLVLHAVLATEDARFLSHRGVDPQALLRAALNLARTGTRTQGGSTITMQLARNLLLSREKTYRRKLLEIMLAWRIEQELSKPQILELYLNTIFLGQRAYGIGAAAQVYYGVDLDALDLAQAAMLAGLAQSPSLANPVTDPQRARQRRNHVLGRMFAAGFITATEYQNAIREPITARLHYPTPEVVGAGHFAEWVRLEVFGQFQEATYTRGLRVYTSLDATLQAKALAAVRQGLHTYDQRHGHPAATTPTPTRPHPAAEAALVALDPRTGAIRALIGGFDFAQSQFNRAVQAERQPGSAFKPMIYAAAFAGGFSPATVLDDAPMTVPGGRGGRDWQPRNFSGRFYGPTRLREAMTWSRNLPSVRLLEQQGVAETRTALRAWGLPPASLPDGLSLALGSGNLTPLQLSQAYAVLANGGYRVEPWFITHIEDSSGRMLMQRQPEPPVRVLPETVAYQMTDLLRDVIRRGTGQRAHALGRQDLAGKTGTTNERRDTWFSGYNGHLLATVWVGFDDNRSLGNSETGASAALPIWIDFMAAALRGQPETPWPEPPGLTRIRIDADSGRPAGTQSQRVITEALSAEQLRHLEQWHLSNTQPGPEQYHPMQIF